MDILEQLKEVETEYQAAQCRFNNAEEKDDIDIAIAEMNVLEMKRNRLFQIAKKEGVMK